MAAEVVSDKEFLNKVKKLSADYKALGKAEFIKSGSVVIDALLGGGIPKGVFILWSSESGCGKSTGALHISKVYCMQGKRVLYLDYEGGVNEDQLNKIGLREYWNNDENPDGTFLVYQVQTYKDGETLLDELMSDVDLVVIDSMTSILTEKVKGSSSEDILPGQDARVSSIFLKKYKAEAIRKGVTWIMINQMRTHIRFMGTTTDEEAGGNALKFYPDIRVMMKKAYKGTLERDEDTAVGKQKVPFGAICSIWTEKNRYARPKIPLNLAVIFGRGISNEFAYYDFLEREGAIKKTGGWYTVNVDGGDVKLNGMNKVIDWIANNREIVKDFIESKGGYKLLMNEEPTVNLKDEINNSDIDVQDFSSEFDSGEGSEDVGEGDRIEELLEDNTDE